MQQSRLVGLVAMALSLALGGCASHGPKKEILIETGYGEATIVAPSQYVSDYLMDTRKLELMYVVPGKPDDKQKAAVASVETGCQEAAMTAHPNLFVAGVSDAVKGGAIGAIAQGIGASAAYGESANRINDYPVFGLAFSGISAGLHGPFNENVSRNDTVRRCGATVMTMFPQSRVRVIIKSPR